MCRWIAYSGEPIFIEDFVTVPTQSLVVQSQASREAKSSVNGDGFGLGGAGERDEPGIFRDRRPAWSDENLIAVAR
ncbi:MAG: class II glutamine amidotransferase, partial [Hyphomicrobiaceae bacterium]